MSGDGWGSGWDNEIVSQVIIVGPGGELLVYNPAIALGDLIASIAGSEFTDSKGNLVFQGIASYGNSDQNATQIIGNTIVFWQGTTPGNPDLEVAEINGSLPGVQVELFGWNVVPKAAQYFAITGFGGSTVWVAPSNDTTGATDGAFINSLFTAGAVQVNLLPGNFYTNATITPGAGMCLRGAGQDISVIHVTSGTIDGVASTGQNSVKLADFTVAGPATGTGNGIHLTGNVSAAASHLTIEDVAVNGFPGGVGILLDTVILTRLTRCTVATCATGYQATNDFGSCTSLTFTSCYAAGNSGTGYTFDAAQYCALEGCGSDNNATGYSFFGCQGISLNGCGTEGFTSTGWDFDNCKGCTLTAAFTFNGKTIGIHITDASTRIGVLGATETSPAAGATAFLQVDAGCSAYVAGITHITGDTLTGTVTNIDGSA